MDHPTAKLRILATTDLHLNLLGFDYGADTQGPGSGLAGLSTLVSRARAEAQQQGRQCLLFDNGDFLQGTPLADWQSTQPVTRDHALIAAFNGLRYDAIGLGNHDLDYDTQYMSQVIAALDAPVLSTNLETNGIAGLEKQTLLTLTVQTAQGPQMIRIGILSVLPLETAAWNKAELPEDARLDDPFSCLATAARRLRAQGADLIVVLAHMGLKEASTGTTTGDFGARVIAQMSQVDVVIAGHTHQRFPQIDPATQLQAPACPTVSPGNAASDLGVIDLDLRQNADGGWDIADHHSMLWPQNDQVPPDPAIIGLGAAAHQATRAYLAEEIGQTPIDLYSYFGLVHPSATMALSARAKAIIIKQALVGHAHAALPLLATATARAVGGANGPLNYVHIPKGPVLRRHLTGFAPATNRICAVVVTGSDLKKWLEHSARVYNRLSPDMPNQPLLDAGQPSFIFDTIYGLNYLIDPSQAVGNRITSLTYKGKPVTPAQRFTLATNHFRAAGGGGYQEMQLGEPVVHSPLKTTELIENALRTGEMWDWMTDTPWQLCCGGRVQTVFECSPNAMGYLDQIRHVAPQILARTPSGFDRIQITL